MYLNIFYQILPLFLIIFVGGIIGYFNKNFKASTITELNKFAYFIGFPCIILNSFLSIDHIPLKDVQVALINMSVLTIFIVLIILVTNLIFKTKSLQNTYFICCFFGNVAYLGFPLVYSINENYATSLSLHIASYLVVLFTIGIARLEISKNNGQLNYNTLAKAIFLNPLLLATFAGILITILKIELPVIAETTIKMISASASPIVLFALGIFVVQNQLVKTSLIHAAFISFIKLLILPLIFWTLSFSILKNYDLTVSIMIASMPVAITPFILAEIYDMDKKIVANAIIISTILGVLIIPFIIYWN